MTKMVAREVDIRFPLLRERKLNFFYTKMDTGIAKFPGIMLQK